MYSELSGPLAIAAAYRMPPPLMERVGATCLWLQSMLDLFAEHECSGQGQCDIEDFRTMARAVIAYYGDQASHFANVAFSLQYLTMYQQIPPPIGDLAMDDILADIERHLHHDPD